MEALSVLTEQSGCSLDDDILVENVLKEVTKVANKVTSLEEALSIVQNGTFLALGGMTLYRKPMAFVRGLIVNGVRDLKLLSFSGSIDVDLLLAACCVEEVRTCYTGMDFLGLAPNFRKAVEEKKVRLVEETELTITSAIRAALQQAPFYAVKQLLGTDILKVREDIKVFKCPISGDDTVAIPPLQPDVAVIHVQCSDKFGNAVINGQLCIDRQLSELANKVILTTEKIVPSQEIENSSAKAQINGLNVDAVVRVPFGAYPTSCFPYYIFDTRHLMAYLDMVRKSGPGAYLEEYVYGAESHAQYLEKAGGVDNLLQLMY